jgi:hypothetical protein
VLGASEAEFDFGAHGREQLTRGLDVADLWNVFEGDGLICQSAAAMHGRAAFLEPLMRIVPSRGSPPRITSLSMVRSPESTGALVSF